MTENRGGGAGVPEGEWMICAVCRRVLERLEQIDRRTGKVINFTWQHSYEQRVAGEDHPPMPVREADFNRLGQISERCDFCHAEDPAWVLPVSDFNMFVLGNTEHTSRSDWSCCDDCAELIRKGYWDRLTKRAQSEFKRRHGGAPMPEIDAMMRALYRKVSDHVTGPVYPNPAHRSSTEETGGTE